MEVILKKPHVFGNRVYQAGKQFVPDNLAHNITFKKMVSTGVIQVLPRDTEKQKIQMSHDMKAMKRAKLARQASKSAKAASGAQSTNPSAVGSDQILHTPAKPIFVEETAEASAPVSSTIAPTKKVEKKGS